VDATRGHELSELRVGRVLRGVLPSVTGALATPARVTTIAI